MTARLAWGALLFAAAAVVWTVCAGVPWPARACVVFLLVPLPVLMMVQARLLAEAGSAEIAALSRGSAYASSALSLLTLAGLALLCARASHISWNALGIAPPAEWRTQLWWALAVTALAVAITAGSHALGVQESPMLRQLLPRTNGQRAGFIALSVSAGVCEELVFRGFLVTVLYAASGSMLLALLVSSMAFGVVHAYQDPAGVARATGLGLLLALPFVLTGNLAASILAHTAIDVIGGLWLGPRLTR